MPTTLLRVKDVVILIVFQTILDDRFDAAFLKTQEFNEYGFWNKQVYFLGTMIGRMCMYVIGFCLMDCGPIASGFAFNGYDENKQPRFDRIRNVNIEGLIFPAGGKVKYFVTCWNISVHEWLKTYVFMRLLPTQAKDKKTPPIVIIKASAVTFFVSAIWHGFYPGFFVFFFGTFLMDYH